MTGAQGILFTVHTLTYMVPNPAKSIKSMSTWLFCQTHLGNRGDSGCCVKVTLVCPHRQAVIECATINFPDKIDEF